MTVDLTLIAVISSVALRAKYSMADLGFDFFRWGWGGVFGWNYKTVLLELLSASGTVGTYDRNETKEDSKQSFFYSIKKFFKFK